MRSLQEEGIYRTNESGEMMPAEDAPVGGSNEEYMTHRLFFHAGYRVQLLFYDWVPHSRLTYGLSLAAVVILALFYEWFGELRRRSISMLDSPPPIFLAPEPISTTGGAAATSAATSTTTHSSSSKHLGAIGSFTGGSAAAAAALLRQPSHIIRRHCRRLLQHRHFRLLLVTLAYVLHSAAGYLLMLLVMTFNVGVFFAVLFGLALGFFLFRVNHLQDSTP